MDMGLGFGWASVWQARKYSPGKIGTYNFQLKRAELKSFAQPIGIFSDKIVAPAHGGCGWVSHPLPPAIAVT
jgi:hypothetical protein